MKRIIFVRHGKAERISFEQNDYKRNLIDKGMRESEEMAEKLKRKKYAPNFWISSPANRAFQTAKIFANVFQIESSAISIAPTIYEANPSDILQIIQDCADKNQTIMIFGHNPSLSELTSYLSLSEELSLPTAGFAVIEFDCTEWKAVNKHSGNLIDFDFPKSLG